MSGCSGGVIEALWSGGLSIFDDIPNEERVYPVINPSTSPCCAAAIEAESGMRIHVEEGWGRGTWGGMSLASATGF